MNNKAYYCLASSALLILSGCQDRSDTATPQASQWIQISSEIFDTDTTSQLEQAREARNTLQQILKENLLSSIQSDGAHGAVDTCSTVAPQVATQVSEQYHLRIGRTSFKLRNPKNEAPNWMESVIRDRLDQPAYFQDSSGTLAVSYPIHVAPPCMLCHGDEQTISDDVRAKIQAHYPEDNATGFAVGDLRGWFWVEVPAID